MYFKSPYLLAVILLAMLLPGCPGPQAPLASDPMAGVSRYDYSGIRVVQQYNDRGYVHLRLYLAGGPALYDRDRRGLEALAVAGAMEAGAGDMSGREFAARLEGLGAEFRYVSREDYSLIMLDGLADQLKETWTVFSQALLKPRFDAREFAEVRNGMAAWREAELAKPARRVRNAAQTAALGRAEDEAAGDPNEILRWSPGQAKDYFQNELLQKCRMVLLTSGPVDGEDLADLLYDNLDLLPTGDCGPGSAAEPLPQAAPLQALAPESGDPLQYVAAVFARGESDANRPAMIRTLAWLLQRRLNNRSEAAGLDCPLTVRVEQRPGLPLTMTLVSPRALACTELAMSELRSLREKGLEGEEWKTLQREALAVSLLRRENAEGALDKLAECMLYGNWDICGQEMSILQRMNVKSVNALLRNELGGMAMVYQGDTTRIDRKTLGNF